MIIHKFSLLLKIIYAILLILLVYSLIRSGLFYQYDIDELSQAQHTYLLASGLKPYSGFFLPFTPFFYWFIMPVFKLSGFTFSAMLMARFLMLLLFMARTALIFFLTRKIFGKQTAWLFLPLYLFDPFTVFTSMQIRIDNLMLVIFLIGLYLFISALDKVNNRLFFLSGIFMSLSLIVLFKIIPNLAVISGLFSIYCAFYKIPKSFALFLTGLFIPLVLFLGFALVSGILMPILQQTVFDRIAFNSSLINPGSFSFFFDPYNPELFGFPGKPLTWLYIFILPSLAAFGGGTTIASIMKKRVFYPLCFAQLILLVLTAVLLIWLLKIKGVFLQYFLNISWLYAVFAASFISFLRHKLKSRPVFFDLSLIALMIIFTTVSIKANLNRSLIGNKELEEKYDFYWRLIPEGTPTFPNILFRPLSYPLALGAFIGDVPDSVLKRLGNVWNYLERDKVKILIIDQYAMQYIDQPSVDYIKKNYRQDPQTDIWTRK